MKHIGLLLLTYTYLLTYLLHAIDHVDRSADLES